MNPVTCRCACGVVIVADSQSLVSKRDAAASHSRSSDHGRWRRAVELAELGHTRAIAERTVDRMREILES